MKAIKAVSLLSLSLSRSFESAQKERERRANGEFCALVLSHLFNVILFHLPSIKRYYIGESSPHDEIALVRSSQRTNARKVIFINNEPPLRSTVRGIYMEKCFCKLTENKNLRSLQKKRERKVKFSMISDEFCNRLMVHI
jgi:hypothetical protein